MFFATALLVAVSLYVPGYLALRGFGVSRVLAFSFAPLLGVMAYVVLGLAYAEFGMWSCWASQTVPLMLAGAVLFAAARKVCSGARRVVFGLSDHGAVRPGSRISFDAACLVGYVLFGVVFAGVLFVWYLGSPDSYAQQYDNISHFATFRASSSRAFGRRSLRRRILLRPMPPSTRCPAVGSIRPRGIPSLRWR